MLFYGAQLDMLITILAFILTLSILIIVHEYGHYRMAVMCGVKVLRFSLGFGKPLWCWKRGKDQTEFVIAPIPFGGYVRMLDEREAPVDEAEAHRAFNRQPLLSRALIVLAGPVSNLVLAVLLFALLAGIGIREPKAVLAEPVPGSMLAQAGLRAGDTVTGFRVKQGEMEPVRSVNDLVLKLMNTALSESDAALEVRRSNGSEAVLKLPLSQVGSKNVGPDLMELIGYGGIEGKPVIAQMLEGSAAQRSGLRNGDVVQSIDGIDVVSSEALVERIRAYDGSKPFNWLVLRNGESVSVTVKPDLVQEDGHMVGRIGAPLGVQPEMVTIHYGFMGSLGYGLSKTWNYSWITLKTMGKMLIGQADVKNLSGPITIADLAGKTVRIGWKQYLTLLALISLSLGVLNLLPLPVLDGGHLVFYVYEAVRGKPVPEVWMLNLQRVGVLLLLLLMLLATSNDVFRLWLSS